MPPEIADAPEVPLGLGLYYDAFWDLSSSRSFGLAAGPISWTVIVDYARAYGLDEVQTDDLIYYVREMDNVWLDHHKPKGSGGKITDQGKKGSKWRPPEG